ncbi:hypothetical protein HPB51_003196 [Rhipicephalus microplus]|uniref:MADF domain-containing protein n=1 Tax=Rhipicephalus microplus TaxID=6941 RepID=A0A9J6ELB7_RHIMP|nr:hypothetical protein HPB51_003196 [Rhipicephalus microplus]
MPGIFTRAGSCSLGSSQSNAAAAGFCSSCLSAAMAALCKLSAMAVDNEKLISCVASRTSLWLATHKNHKNRQVKDALWKDVGQIMYPGKASKECITALQKRWKFLRDKFRRLFVLAQKKKESGMGTEDADSDTEDEGDEGNPPADSPVQPASWPFYEQLVFLRDTMTFRETSGNFESQRRQRKEVVRQVARQETPETLFRDMCPSQFDTIELDQTDYPADLYPAPVVSVECSPSLLEPGMSFLEATQSSESAPSPLGTASPLGLAATSVESQGSSLASMSVMQPPKKKTKGRRQ